jgi:hypothetical protein
MKEDQNIWRCFALIKNKNPEDFIYEPGSVSDIDIYSSDPINDVIKLCNILFNLNYKFILGFEAIHKNTYSIRVNQYFKNDERSIIKFLETKRQIIGTFLQITKILSIDKN